MSVHMYKGENVILVHPSKVEWMEQNGWTIVVVEEPLKSEDKLSNEEVKENGDV